MLMSTKNMDTGSGGVQTSAVQLFAYTLTHEDSYGVVYSGVKFDNDGNLYILQSSNNYGLARAWLVSGAASGFYITRSIFSGTLDTDAGAGPLVMSTDRIYYISQKFFGSKTTVVDFEISNDISGSPVLANARITLSAELTDAPEGVFD